MKKCIGLFACGVVMSIGVALAHHPLEDINEEIFLLVDEMVAGTPHADMVMDDMGGGNNSSSSADMVIVTDDMTTLSNLVDDGLFTYVDQLVGVVTVIIEPSEVGNDVVTTILLEE